MKRIFLPLILVLAATLGMGTPAWANPPQHQLSNGHGATEGTYLDQWGRTNQEVTYWWEEERYLLQNINYKASDLLNLTDNPTVNEILRYASGSPHSYGTVKDGVWRSFYDQQVMAFYGFGGTCPLLKVTGTGPMTANINVMPHNC